MCKEAPLLVEVTADGAILLRQAGVYPLEINTEDRIREFQQAFSLSAQERRRLKALKQ